MSDDDLDLVHGSGNVYRDLKRPHADLAQARALVAAQIVRSLDARGLTTRDAEAATGVAHSEFSRIRNAQLRRFTLDRLVTILDKPDGNLEVRLVVRPRRPEARASRPGGARPGRVTASAAARRRRSPARRNCPT